MDDKMKYDAGFTGSATDVERGFQNHDEGLPPKTVKSDFGEYPNPDRMVYDDQQDEMVDAYRGGFVSRYPEID